MRTVGQFNSKPIFLKTLLLTNTYDGYISMDEEYLMEANKSILDQTIKETVFRCLGTDRNFLIINQRNLNVDHWLPSETVVADLICYQPTKTGDLSSLIIVWFQKENDDTFSTLEKIVHVVDWQNEAKDGLI